MGREVRRVPADWQHPKDKDGRYIPLHGRSYAKDAADWDEEYEQWQKGFRRSFADGEKWKPKEGDEIGMAFSEWTGHRPSPTEYMPDWPEEQRTHLMMYEDTSEGTPISPAFKTPEELARWLADHKASAFGNSTATYEQWLATIGDGYAIGMVYDNAKGLRSGVEFAGERSAR